LRELYEETSVRSVSLLAEAPDWYAYDLPAMVAGRAWRGRYRGQIQKWFAFRFEGSESEIDIHRPGGGHHRPEFDEWRWVEMHRLPELIIPFKRPVYESVVAAFGHLAGAAAQG
jgi:putative (di)nucleoside polyphosphate hydrolase